MADKDCPGKSKDLINIGPAVGERDHLFVRHTPSCELQAGILHVTKEGEPIPEGTTLIQLKKHEGSMYEVEELYSRPSTSLDAPSKPAKVTSNAYRSNWDNIFGNKAVGQA
jgi:hypothetical protein